MALLDSYSANITVGKIIHRLIDSPPASPAFQATIELVNTDDDNKVVAVRNADERAFLEANYPDIVSQFETFLGYRRNGGGPAGTAAWHYLLRTYGGATDMYANGRTVYLWIDDNIGWPRLTDADHLNMSIRVFALDDQGQLITDADGRGVSYVIDGRQQINGTNILITAERTAIANWVQTMGREALERILGITVE